LFEQSGELSIGIKQKYPVYSVTTSKGNSGTILDGSRLISPVSAVPLTQEETAQGGSISLVPSPRILIVDDEHDILLVYKQFLSDQPVQVDVFADPIQLLGYLALVGPSYYDVAIIDIRMPKMDGFRVYQILAALKPTIKALFVSAFDYTDEVLSALRRIGKEDDFIRKPISRENFVSAVNQQIESLRKHKEFIACTIPPSGEVEEFS
jgi:CheY-like chemotaxis protein